MESPDPVRVLLGVTGGIAAYKSAEIVRRLRERGAEVQVVMTAGARQFVTPLTFQALSGRPVRSDLWDEAAEAAMGHIELARWADRILVAPATAGFIGRLAHGLADDLLTTLCLATDAPLSVAPAMNRLMWANAATQANVALLRSRGITILGPGVGDQACGETGLGRMLEPAELVDAVLAAAPTPAASAVAPGALAGRKVLVTAGPTRERIDPVRFITNRSSGKMGYAGETRYSKPVDHLPDTPLIIKNHPAEPRFRHRPVKENQWYPHFTNRVKDGGTGGFLRKAHQEPVYPLADQVQQVSPFELLLLPGYR